MFLLIFNEKARKILKIIKNQQNLKKLSNLPNFAMNHREMNEKNTKYNHLAIRCYKRSVLTTS